MFRGLRFRACDYRRAIAHFQLFLKKHESISDSTKVKPRSHSSINWVFKTYFQKELKLDYTKVSASIGEFNVSREN